jgi:hypothetical protein
VGTNTIEPGCRLSAGASGKSAGSGSRSATVTYPVSATNAANSAFVTVVASIEKASTRTRWVGASSG